MLLRADRWLPRQDLRRRPLPACGLRLPLELSGDVRGRFPRPSDTLLVTAVAGGPHPDPARVASRTGSGLAAVEMREGAGHRDPLLPVEPCPHLLGRGAVEVGQSDVARRHRALCRIKTAHLADAGILGAGALPIYSELNA